MMLLNIRKRGDNKVYAPITEKKHESPSITPQSREQAAMAASDVYAAPMI